VSRKARVACLVVGKYIDDCLSNPDRRRESLKAADGWRVSPEAPLARSYIKGSDPTPGLRPTIAPAACHRNRNGSRIKSQNGFKLLKLNRNMVPGKGLELLP